MYHMHAYKRLRVPARTNERLKKKKKKKHRRIYLDPAYFSIDGYTNYSIYTSLILGPSIIHSNKQTKVGFKFIKIFYFYLYNIF